MYNRLFFILLILFPCIASAQIILPANMFADSAYAPFLYGVTSGDPLADQVIIWTRSTPASLPSGPVTVEWEMAEDPQFSQIVQNGSVSTDSTRDWTVKVDVAGLSARTRYYYRFRDAQGNYSQVGRTQTAPNGPTQRLRIALASCSSIYSGFFNGYARIAERNALDLIIHLGDFIYDYADSDEEVRMPDPEPEVPVTLTEWRDRHSYYLLDPDLRAARAAHPWVVIWDNHDLEVGDSLSNAAAMQAFLEYLPIRLPDPQQPEVIYRSFQYGDLLDLVVMDVRLWRDQDNLPGGAPSIIGNPQWTWLSTTLNNSTAKWRLICSQKMFGNWSVVGLPAFIPFGDGPIADDGAWDGYPEDRERVLDFLEQNNIENNVFLSGDAHVSFVMDLPKDPWGNNYNPSDGSGSLAVEFLPTSITRGNFDEAGYGGWLADLAQTAMMTANPNHIFEELESHGYGLLDISPDSVVAEIWYSKILSQQNNENFEVGLVVDDGANHWRRNTRNSPLLSREDEQLPLSGIPLQLFPNPSHDQFSLLLELDQASQLSVKLFDLQGQEIGVVYTGAKNKGQQLIGPFGRELPPGVYVLEVKTEKDNPVYLKLVKQ